MSSLSYSIFPKVYKARGKQTVTVHLIGDMADTAAPVSIKIQPMEKYAIEHTTKYRIDEEYRYPYLPMTRCADGSYTAQYDFSGEQRYSFKLKLGESALGRENYLYAVEDDLLGLDIFKGDTHLHTNRSDGEGTPLEVGLAYRRAGYDFIAITDHHKMYPSVEGKEAFEALTDRFTVIRAEEVHNKSMGYFHIINLGGSFSVNEIIEASDGIAEREVEKILATQTIPEGAAPYVCAYRTFVSNKIREGGGAAIMAHPYWSCYGEYNMQTADVYHLLRSGCYDALELLAGCDGNNNGNNLQLALWQELLASGVRIPVLGASDAHSTTSADSLFNVQFSLVFARDKDGIIDAIKAGRSVAVLRRGDTDFLVFGSFRLVKYARFLLDEYFPAYTPLAAAHADALESADKAAITRRELVIDKFKETFFA